MSPKFILFVSLSVFCFWKHADGGPTVVPADPFNAEKDADLIWDAVDGCGTNEDKISKVICKRTFKQRIEISTAFESKHEGKNLLKRLEKETSRDLKKLYRRLLESSQAVLANDLHDYVDGKREDKYGGVTEILCGTDAYDKSLLGAYYLQTFNMDVMDHVKSKYKAGDQLYQNVLIDYCWRTYCTNVTLDTTKIQAAAVVLANLDPKADGETLKGQLQNYFKTYCLPDLQCIFASYRSIKNKGINEAIREAMKGDEADAWVALTLSIETRYRYYANLLHQAVDGCGTDEDRINRITVQTCERYLGDIDNEYKCMHGESFYKRIAGLTGDFLTEDDYKDCMRMLYGQ
ncbi:annexin B9-like [Planococcus citri]|uniref:annexin B9-like n=1 Tax=Planococcus citri TaxID=170843 RepID=UPI0031F8BE9F